MPGAEAGTCVQSALRCKDAQLWPQTSRLFELTMPFLNLPPAQLFRSLRYPSLSFFLVLTTGSTQSTLPKDSPLGCLLKNLKALGLTNLKPKLIFYCDTAWPQNKLGDQKVWRMNRALNYNTILQLDLYCCHSEKWPEVPYIQAFFKLSLHFLSHVLVTLTSLPPPFPKIQAISPSLHLLLHISCHVTL